jgi:ATP-dependent helicase/nuclease subunit B
MVLAKPWERPYADAMPQQRVFVSDSFAVLQDALVTAVHAVKEAEPLTPMTVVTTSAPLAVRLRRAIARVGKGHFALRVCTLADFAREVAEDSLLDEGRRLLPALAAPLLMKGFLEAAGAENYFSPLASLPGFPPVLLATLNDLAHANISPQLLHDFLDRAPQGEVSRQKVESLKALYERYLRFLAECGFYDDRMIVERAIALLETDGSPTPLFLYGFYDFTPLQRRFVAAAVNGRDTLAFFPWRAGEAYAHAASTLTWLTNLGFQVTPLVGKSERDNKLSRLQAQLFEERPSSRARVANKADQSVLFLSAPSESQEAREIGRLILDFVHTHGVKFNEVGVFLRDSARYRQLLAETLLGLGIPCFLQGGLPLSRTIAGQRLLLLCRVLQEDYARSRVIEFIGTVEPPFSSLLGEQAPSARLAQWELFSVQAGVVKGSQAWRERLARLLAEQPESENEEGVSPDRHVLSAFLTFMDGLLMASEQRRQAESWREWTDFLLRLMHAYISPTDHTDAVEETLVNLAELDLLENSVSLEEFCHGVVAALHTSTVPVGAFDSEGVFVGDVLAARGLQFRAVIIPGLVDGTFPRLVRQDPLLLDQERQYLAEFLSCELRQRRGLSEAEQLLFMLAIQSAREWVVFSYPRAEQGGGLSRTPSFYLLRALEALTGEPASFTELREWEQRAPLLPGVLGPANEAMDAIEYHLLSAGHALASGDPTFLGYLPELSPFFPGAFQATRQRWQTERLTPFEGMIESADVREQLQHYLFPAGLRLSASALETYARCPFRYFLTAVLRLDQMEEPEHILSLQPRDRGALLHDILHEFFTRAREAGWFPLVKKEKATVQQLLQQVAAQRFARFSQVGATGFPLLWEIEQERMLDRLFAFLEREYESGEGFLPAAFEVRFGAEEIHAEDANSSPLFPNGSVRLRLENGDALTLRGRIDRIDLSVDQQRARIVDYKTGKRIAGRFAGGTALQLPLYLYAARALWPDKVWESAAYTYVDRQRKSQPLLFTEANWEFTATTLRDIVSKLTQSLSSGCFAATPEECFPCPFPLICGGHSEKWARRKQDDPRLELLRQVRTVA